MPNAKPRTGRPTRTGEPSLFDEGKPAAKPGTRPTRAKPPEGSRASAYEAKRDAMARKSREESKAGRDIGEIPSVADPKRRAEALKHFRAFCDIYGRQTFNLPWSRNHVRIIDRFDQIIRTGGLYSLADARGYGKTAIAEWAMNFAGLGGFRRFGVLVSKSSGHALASLDSVKKELECNEELAGDFPEVCFPIECLEGIPNRCKSQTQGGRRTGIRWYDDEVVFPTVAGSAASGFIARAVGIEGQIRGMFFKRSDGVRVRPDFCVVDDPQDDELARSPTRVQAMEEVIDKAILGLPGPGQALACVALVTVIEHDDLADRILNRKRKPEWRGERYRTLDSMPSETAMTLWEEYDRIRREDFESGGDGAAGTAFYIKNRKPMDDGAAGAWPERFYPNEASNIQHAMNLYLRNPDAFRCEQQNEPKPRTQEASNAMTTTELEQRTNGFDRGTVPQWANRLTAFIDVQGDALYWIVVAWAEDFTGAVVDYGTWPEQAREYFTLANIKSTLQRRYPKDSEEGRIHTGLRDLTSEILGREWERDGGDHVKVDRCLIDASWGNSTEVVYRFCRSSVHAALLSPSHGRGIGASRAPMRDWTKQPGERVGAYWRFRRGKQQRSIRHVVYDTNHWKSFVAARLRTSIGSSGSISFFGRDARHHRMLVEHLTSEMPVRTEASGNVVDEWRIRQPGLDNHWLDGIVGCAVAASMLGVKLTVLEETSGERKSGRKFVSSAEVRARKSRRQA